MNKTITNSCLTYTRSTVNHCYSDDIMHVNTRESKIRIEKMYMYKKTDLYHFRRDGSRGRNRRWFMAKGGRRRSRTDAGRRQCMTLDSLPSGFGVSFLLDGAAVLWTLQQQNSEILSSLLKFSSCTRASLNEANVAYCIGIHFIALIFNIKLDWYTKFYYDEQ